MTTASTLQVSGPIKQLTVVNDNHLPHWKKPGAFKRGVAKVEFCTHDAAGWLSIDTQEFCKNHGGNDSGKRTMITLRKPESMALYAQLKGIFEPLGCTECEKAATIHDALAKSATKELVRLTRRLDTRKAVAALRREKARERSTIAAELLDALIELYDCGGEIPDWKTGEKVRAAIAKARENNC